jgi:hypothetical protein
MHFIIDLSWPKWQVGHWGWELDTESRKIRCIEEEIQARRSCVLYVKCPYFWSIATKHTSVVGHGGGELDMEFPEKPLNGRRDTVTKVLYSTSKVPFVKDWSQLTSVVAHGGLVLEIEFHKDPLNERRGTAENVLCSSSKVTFIIEQSWPNLTRFVACGVRVLYMQFHENPVNGSRDITEKVLCSPCQVPFIIDRLQLNLTSFVGDKEMNARYRVAG